MLEKFAIGTRWFRRDYEFIIIHNNGKVAEYKKIYEDGSVDKQIGGFITEADAPTQLRIHEGVLFDKEQAIKKTMGLSKKKKVKSVKLLNIQAHFYTLGFLVKHAYLGMRVIENTKEEEGEWYKDITGRFPWEEEFGYEFDSCPDTWATKMYVAFSRELLSENLTFPTEVNFEESRACVYNTVWCRELISIGYRLGRGHRVDRIREAIPKEYINYFEEGLK